MNDNRRNRLKGAIELLSEAGDIVEEIGREEQDALDNLPDSIQSQARSASQRAPGIHKGRAKNPDCSHALNR